MNWERGLFRLWVLLSLLWMVLSTAFVSISYALADAVSVWWNGCFPASPAENPFGDHALSCFKLWRQIWAGAEVAALSGLGVPAVIGVLAFAGMWVARGFKNPN